MNADLHHLQTQRVLRAALQTAAAGVQVSQATYADFLIECVALAVQEIHDPRDRLARQVGMLQGEVRRLCAQLEAEQPQGDDESAEPDLFADEPLPDPRYADRAAADWWARRVS
jgi:hypothetical protein